MIFLAVPLASIAGLILLAAGRRNEPGREPLPPRREPAAAVTPDPGPVAAPAPAEKPRPEKVPGPLAEKIEGLGTELGLDEAQRSAYRNLLETYALRFDALHRATDWTRAGSRLQFASDHRRLQEEFDLLVVRLLTPAQAELYAGLPEWTRSADLGSVALELQASRRR
jgi:hypothetical protein